MGKKLKGSQKEKKKVSKILSFGTFVFFAGALVVLGVYFYLSNSVTEAFSPVYEEAYAVSSDLKTQTELVERTLAGDQSAWEVLMRHHQEPAYRLAFLICGDPDEAA